MFEAFWGSALKVRRVYREMDQEELLHQLNERTGRNLSLALLNDMEQRKKVIDQKLFVAWCDILGCSQATIIKDAQSLEQSSRLSKEDKWRVFIQELDYLNWKSEHKDD
ncbi:MAG: hypothetical protein A3E36_01305 [Candidatus Andersenbacteria bacterium RIFCSPHIGHO2_12_FULL_45_11b]|uniref:HTH cro/C1-type domain-containing protein n=1 Tax=Candidatus Andersenbacteria bacterium RIFCSPHIGHO2_12_FULL_45_11b TaxID=1797282 RepID=A0A1G1XBK5_9BACT|nr:MAG: hypothetical protein A3E36_01305 [Candidatus Andersenbacteria bacterium RIFCSPHIGHO2_12_FULL_45_11b]